MSADAQSPPVGESSTNTLREGLVAQRESFRRHAPDHADRRHALDALLSAVLRFESDFVAALNADFGGRARQETRILEIFPLVGEIRGIGMMTAIEWAKPGTREPAGEGPMRFPAAVSARAQERGLIVRALWECTAVSPPLCTSGEEVDEIVGILAESVEAAAE